MTALSDRVDALEATNTTLVNILNGLRGTLQDIVDSSLGPQGWSPVLSVKSDGARRVLQVTGWTGGGSGSTQPAVGDYIGVNGLVATAAEAIDIRGASGADGSGWTGATYDAGTGVVTFTSNDGLGFTTGDLRGEKGDPGALFDWTGPWVTATAYTEGQGAESGGSSYVCIANHTSDAATEPGVGGSWQTVWDLSAAKGDPGSGDVSSVDVSGGTGITSSGGPITSTGSITVALNTATQTSLGLADTSIQPSDIGTAAALNVAATGDAAVGEAVKGDDTRLSDARPPTTHTHTLAQVTDAGTAAAAATTDFATADQGTAADTAIQPGSNADTLGSGAATDRQVLAADGAGGAAWENISGGYALKSTTVISAQVASVDIALPSGTGPLLIRGKNITILEDDATFSANESPISALVSTDGVTFPNAIGDYVGPSNASLMISPNKAYEHFFEAFAYGANDTNVAFMVSSDSYIFQNEVNNGALSERVNRSIRNAKEAITHIRLVVDINVLFGGGTVEIWQLEE